MRSPCCDEKGLKKGPWTTEEDEMLIDYISKNGHGSWRALPKLAGLNRCGKSCRLRWTNYLRPDIKRGKFSEDEERIITNLHSVLGNKWSKIAAHLPGRTDNEIKNFWNTYMRKKMLKMGIDPTTHKPTTDYSQIINLSHLLLASNNLMPPNALSVDHVAQLAKLQVLQSLMQLINNPISAPTSNLGNMSQLFGTQNLSLLEGLIGSKIGTQAPQDYANPQPQYGNQGAENPWACFEDLLNSEDNSNQNGVSSSCCHDLPDLVSASPETSEAILNQGECKMSPASNSFSTQLSPTSTDFDEWEKFIEDENSFWGDILA